MMSSCIFSSFLLITAALHFQPAHSASLTTKPETANDIMDQALAKIKEIDDMNNLSVKGLNVKQTLTGKAEPDGGFFFVKHEDNSLSTKYAVVGLPTRDTNTENNDIERADLKVNINVETNAGRKVVDLKTDQYMKYDAEWYESRENKTDNDKMEELHVGSGLLTHHDYFPNVNIEMNAESSDGGETAKMKSVKHTLAKEHNMIVSCMVVLFAFVSVSMYIFMVMWRRHQQHYIGREMVVAHDTEAYTDNRLGRKDTDSNDYNEYSAITLQK